MRYLRSQLEAAVLADCPKIRIPKSISFALLLSCSVIGVAFADQIKVVDMLPLERDQKVRVELTIANCSDRIFDATITSDFEPIDYFGRAIVLGGRGCDESNWNLSSFSASGHDRSLVLQDGRVVVPAGILKTTPTAQVLGNCYLKVCQIFQFESSAGGAIDGARSINVDEHEFLQMTDVDMLFSKNANNVVHYKFAQQLKAKQPEMFAAIRRVIVLSDGSCKLLVDGTHDYSELRVLESCKE